MALMKQRKFAMVLVLAGCCVASDAWTQDDEAPPQPAEPTLAGHSYHGEAFNEGPRQRAYLMEGMSKVDFPVTTSVPRAQKFVTQGVAQLHGFWYFEAERSFRQAAMLDENCAMSYWGMAMANKNNEERAKGFVQEAMKRRDRVTKREKLYIEGLDRYIQAGKKKNKERAQRMIKDWEQIIYQFPNDVEAHAFLALQTWLNRNSGVPITSHVAVDALLDKVFAANPMHAAHHYRIHLWDYERPESALASSALCGQSSPGIAHMWHMPGHIYSRVKRYNDACYQQEASARVDHAHMMRDRVMPDQISNFAHNNEWFIRNMMFVGRIHDGIDLARNMTELPRHPKYNTLSKRGSYSYGRTRLFEILTRYEMWDLLIAECERGRLVPTSKDTEQIKRMRHLGMAYFQANRIDDGNRLLEDLRSQKQAKEAEQKQAVDRAVELVKWKEEKVDDKKVSAAKKAAEKPFSNAIRHLDRAIKAVEGHQAFVAGDFEKAHTNFKAAGGTDTLMLNRALAGKGETKQAIEAMRSYLKSHKNEVRPLAGLAHLLWEDEQQEEAIKLMKELRALSEDTDLDSPVFDRVAPIAAHLKWPSKWQVEKKVRDDVGNRPSLDELGPFRWSPMEAPAFNLVDTDGKFHALQQHKGRPLIVIFYLGYGCLHCAEQLHAFAPMKAEFDKAGIDLVAISTDGPEGLTKSLENFRQDTGSEIPFPLLSDEKLDIFKAYRAFDDFENQPLHGTFLIDSNGKVRWQDISYEPFMDPDFVLEESQRLLKQGSDSKRIAAKKLKSE